MNSIHKAALVAATALALSGCATVINGTSQDVQIASEPSGAQAKLTNGTTCTTPCEVNLKRRHDLRVDLTKDGYKSVYVLVQSRTGGAAAGNILLGGLIGGVVDGSNGASNHLAPNPVSVKLIPLGSDGQEILLDKKGKDAGTVQAHNDKVRTDVAKTIGADAAGVQPPSAPEAAAAAASAAVASEPAAEPAPVPASEPAPAPTAG
jgi:hypothetical protein